MLSAELVLLTANAVYGTAYVVMRPAVDAFGPVTLAFLRLAIGFASSLRSASEGAPRGRRRSRAPTAAALFWMGFIGFTLAMAAHALGPRVVDRHQRGAPGRHRADRPRRPGAGRARRASDRGGKAGAPPSRSLGATVIVVNGVPGLTVALAPHWRGDLLLLLSGVCFAAYSLLGRPLLARHPSIRVTAWSFLWGLLTTAPLAAVEWQVAGRSPWTAMSVAAVLYLGVVMTGLGYLVWNWALERVSAARAAIYLNVQPLVGALLGVVWLGEPLSVFTVAGGSLVVLGLWLALTGRPASA